MSNYVLSGPTWAGPAVSWYFSGAAGFEAEIAEAFARWDSVIGLDFVMAASAGTADITLNFAYIDGSYNTLGFAETVWMGDNHYVESTITFDTAEVWTWSSSAGSYVLGSGDTFYEVALHEIGHAIGLDHATNSATLMYFNAGGSATDLTYWDIYGAQQLYGPEATSPDLAIANAPTLSVSNATEGATVRLTYSITNWGTSAGTSTAGIYLSTDSTITTADMLLSADAVAALAGAGATAQRFVDISTVGLAPGTYYLGVVADHDAAVAEADEANNASAAVVLNIIANPFTEGQDVLALPFASGLWYALGGNDVVTGTSGVDRVFGNAGRDTLLGRSGNDYLWGDDDNDEISGGAGRDVLAGGAGADDFNYISISETGRTSATRDVITDFRRGSSVAGDDIDLHLIDAKSGVSGNNDFKFIGAQAFHKVKGELHYRDAGAHVLVEGDVNGDGRADFSILVQNVAGLSAGDFIL